MSNWRSFLRYDPLPALLSSEHRAIALFAARDLLGRSDARPEVLWDLPEAHKIVNRQQKDGSWKYSGGNARIRSSENYDQIETFRNLGYLIEMYGYDRRSPAVTKAAEFFFRYQTEDGDVRGILGNQYTPYYTAAIAELLIKAGFVKDDRIEKIFGWLGSIRQDDRGWAIPLRTQKKNLTIISRRSKLLEPDRSKPFSHMVTGVVLRAYAAHPKYRQSMDAHRAGELLLSNFFRKDNYPDRKSPEFWSRFSFPFWFTDLVSAMDSLTILGFPKDEPQIEKAIRWFVSHQAPSGHWNLHTVRNKRFESELWVSLAICRIIKRLYK